MSDLILTIHVPEALVERAHAANIHIEDQSIFIIEALEREIERAEAFREIGHIARDLQALPDSLKPAPEEIEDEIRAYWKARDSNHDQPSP